MRVLVIEDELELARLVCDNLRRAGHAPDTVDTLELAEAALSTATYDIVLLDLNLPDGDGLRWLKRMRAAKGDIPVIALTARDSAFDRVAGLDGGADDYVVKPFVLDELLARMRAVIRRREGVLAPQITLANVSFEPARRTVQVNGEPVVLGRRELALLEVLLSRAGRVAQRTDLDGALYSMDDVVDTNALEAVVSRLRRKLVAVGAQVSIHTVRGVGYMLEEKL
jgi:two-component system, OmpR family, response regulator QseB